LPLAADPAEPGSQHLRGAEQPAVPGDEDHDGGAGPAEVRTVCCVPAGYGVLRGGEWHRSEDNIAVDGQQIGKKALDYIDMAQDRQVAGLCESGNEHSGSIKYGALLGCCRSTVFLGVKWLVGWLVSWLVGWVVSLSASWSVSQAGRQACCQSIS